MNSFKIENLVRANVAKMKPYSSARDEFKADGRKMIFLDANENPFENGVNRYPDPRQGKLKLKIADLKEIAVSKILLGNGSDEVLDLIFRAFCEPGKDNVISLPPTYGMYKVLANLNEIEDREVLLTEDFQPDVEGILKRVDSETKLIFICSPNNPTGNTFTEKSITDLLNNFKGLVVIDEAYIDFSINSGWLQRLEEFPNLVITQTFSKAYGLAGIRLGICYASEEIIQILNKIKPPYNINELTQQKATEKLQNRMEIEREIGEILVQRESLKEELQKVGFIKKIFPSEANFLLVRVDDANLRYSQLLEKGLVVRNRSNQPLCENTIRFTVGTEAENQILINALNEIAE